MAEAMVARYAVEVSTWFGYDNLIFEGDASTVVNTMKNKIDGAAPIFRVYNDISRIVGNFDCFSFSHVKRVSNVFFFFDNG